MSSDLLEAGLETAPPETRVPVTIERAVSAIAMAALCLITFANVVVRYLTDASFAFTEEYSIFLLVVMTLTGAAVAVAANRHIRITFFIERWSPKARRRADLVAWGASLAMFAVLVVLGARLAYDEWRFEDTSPGLGVPQFLYTMWMPILAVVVLLRILGRIAVALKGRPE